MDDTMQWGVIWPSRHEIRYEIVSLAYLKAYLLLDSNGNSSYREHEEFLKKIISEDMTLTKVEKIYLSDVIEREFDKFYVKNKKGEERLCMCCQNWTYARQYCEFCVQKYLKDNFANRKSGEEEIDSLILKCQLSTITPDKIIEWIPYEQFSNIKFVTIGGYSTVFTADWNGGRYEEWNTKDQKLQRRGEYPVILKRLNGSNNLNKEWLHEAESHFNLTMRLNQLVDCFGLTKDPITQEFILVLMSMNCNLRDYLQKYDLSWLQRIRILYDIIFTIYEIHKSDSIHRDLHSGNILQCPLTKDWTIGDLGFCGPIKQESHEVYGNLPYLAPEVLNKKKQTKKSDIYIVLQC